MVGCVRNRVLSGLVCGSLMVSCLVGTDMTDTASAAPVTGLMQSTSATVVNVTTTLNIRKGPSLSDQVVGRLNNNAKISVTGFTSDGWLRISVPGVSVGYVSAQYVKVPLVSVAVTSASVKLSTGKSAQVGYSLYPGCATNKTVTWASSNPTVATVSSSGIVQALSAGTAKITVRTADGGKTATATYTVTGAALQVVPVSSVSLGTLSPIMSGNTKQLTAMINPTNATNQSVTWSSSATAVATISSTGLLTPKLTGLGKSTSVTVSVKTVDGGKSASAPITVYTVQDVQTRLNTLGCRGVSGLSLVVDGVLGTNSIAAIKMFQGASGLTVDGVTGSLTLAALFGSSGASCVGAAPALTPLPAPSTPQTSPTASTPGGGTATDGTSGTTNTVTDGSGLTVSTGQPVLSGQTEQLTATIKSTNQMVIWTSNNPAIATVTVTGLVTGTATGKGRSDTAVITATSVDGGLTTATTVIVYTIEDMQTALNSLACTGADNKSLTVDGVVGSNTASAIKDFQTANGLISDGQAGSQTLTALFMGSPLICPVKATASGSINLAGFAYKWTGKYVTQEFLSKVLSIASKLRCNPDDLMTDMAFESGLSPYAQNASSGATGLIQFMSATASAMGTTTAKLLTMTAVQQLDYVYNYLQRFAGQLNSTGNVVVAVLWPAAVGQPDSYVLFTQGGSAYAGNAGLDLNHDGAVTKGEAAQRAINVRNSFGLR